MAVYPLGPTPSSIQAPSVTDPMHVFTTDSGVTLRRPKHSRPQRRYQLDYLGKTTAEWRVIRDFLQAQRLGVLPFEWFHQTAGDQGVTTNSTPVQVIGQHAYVTGQWVLIQGSTPNTSLNGAWQITRLSPTAFQLNGSSAGGTGPCTVIAYMPNAVGIFADDEMPSPTKLMGPESTMNTRGRFSWSVLIEEIL